jgi:hypothetical protein
VSSTWESSAGSVVTPQYGQIGARPSPLDASSQLFTRSSSQTLRRRMVEERLGAGVMGVSPMGRVLSSAAPPQAGQDSPAAVDHPPLFFTAENPDHLPP